MRGCLNVAGGTLGACIITIVIGMAIAPIIDAMGGILAVGLWWAVCVFFILPVCLVGCIHALRGGGIEGFKWWEWRP